MKLGDLTKSIKSAEPLRLGEVTAAQIQLVLRTAFAELRSQVEAAGDEPVQVPAFGSFRSRMVDKKGDAGGGKVRVIKFMLAKPKADSEAEA
jgi:hypothetical protein